MDFTLSPEQQALCDAVQKICAEFDDDYWLEHDRTGEFPEDFYRAIADGGWLGVAMPEEYGGAGLGVTEAALMMQAVAGSAGAMSAASAIHLNIFGPHPIVVFGTDEQKQRWLPDLIAGHCKSCFGVTEPDAGLNTTAIKTRAERSGDGYLIHGKKVWTSSAQVADKIMLSEAERMGLMVTDAELRQEILEFPAFQNPDGGFVGAEEYDRILRRGGLTSDSFEGSMRTELLTQKVRSAFNACLVWEVTKPRGHGFISCVARWFGQTVIVFPGSSRSTKPMLVATQRALVEEVR